MLQSIEADNDTLLRQAPMTADTYMLKAVASIDKVFGEGFARKHPELVGQFMVTCALDLGSGVIARATETLARCVEGGIEKLKD